MQSSPKGVSQNLLMLIGGFETTTGEQWLAFRNDGIYSAADYAKFSSEKLSKSRSLQVGMSWNYFELEEMLRRKRFFIIKLLQGAMHGLAFMHEHERLHQSLGPSSVVLNTITERDAAYLVPRLRDLAFSVDIRYPYVEEGHGILSEQLWRRAAAAGAITPFEKRDFAIADDIYEAGLLLAYLAFVPFCESGIIDSLSLQRLLENTFQLDIEATREYCLADDRLLEAVKFLDLGDGAGWELLQAMLNPDYRKRPVAEAVVKHRFMTGGVL
ncbi:Protein kinase domain-containing protein [Psidium guajava]|nr:Protein kinase domain-containing protein [Psidium guajava]